MKNFASKSFMYLAEERECVEKRVRAGALPIKMVVARVLELHNTSTCVCVTQYQPRQHSSSAVTPPHSLHFECRARHEAT